MVDELSDVQYIVLVKGLLKMMKKYFSLLLVIICMLFMVACGKETRNADAVDDMENTFTVNMPCKITFKYSPICKIGIV